MSRSMNRECAVLKLDFHGNASLAARIIQNDVICFVTPLMTYGPSQRFLPLPRYRIWRFKEGNPKNTIKIFYKLLISAHFITTLFIINNFMYMKNTVLFKHRVCFISHYVLKTFIYYSIYYKMLRHV